jgi:hypothetical protein
MLSSSLQRIATTCRQQDPCVEPHTQDIKGPFSPSPFLPHNNKPLHSSNPPNPQLLTHLLTKTQHKQVPTHTPPCTSPNPHSTLTTNQPHHASRPLPMRLRRHKRHVRRVLLRLLDTKHARPRRRRSVHRRRHYAHVLESQRAALGAAGDGRIRAG